MQYPYQNLSLTDIEGEEWRDIPDYGGYLLVSNYGRIWSLPRPIQAKNGYFFYTRELIRKQSLLRRFNPFIKDYRTHLYCHLRYENMECNVSVNRLVYSVFVSPINFIDDKLLIIHKDGDNCNNRWDNLEAMDHTQLYAHDLKLKHKPKTFKRLEGGINHRRQPIIKYFLDGKIADEYDSVEIAAKSNSVHRTNVSNCAKRKIKHLGGYVYRYKGQSYNGEFRNIDIIVTKPVVQFQQNGELLNTYNSITEAASITKIDANSISKSASKKTKLAGGFVWRFKGEGYSGEYVNALNKAKLIHQYQLDGKLVATFESVNKASKITGFSTATLLDCAKKVTKVSHGFVWRFEGDQYNGEFNDYLTAKPVTQYSIDGRKLQSFGSLNQAELKTNVKASNIRNCLYGNSQTAGGFKWKYAGQEEIKQIADIETSFNSKKDNIKGREVNQFSIDGKFLKHYNRVSDAAQATRLSATNILRVIDKNGFSAGGYIWRTKSVLEKEEMGKPLAKNKSNIVTQYTREGVKVQVYSSTLKAQEVTGIFATTIASAARGQLKSAGGYVWQYGDGPDIISIKHLAIIKPRARPVKKYTLDGKFISEYPTLAAAAESEEISPSVITSVLNKRTKSAAGFRWSSNSK